MRMLADGQWVDAGAEQVNQLRGMATDELIETARHAGIHDVMCAIGAVPVEHAGKGLLLARDVPFDGTKTTGNAHESGHQTLLNMTEQKPRLISEVLLPCPRFCR
jgi:hypothetical protein